MDNGPFLSVLIPAFNEEQFITATVESVQRSFRELAFGSFEIIVSNNNSSDRTAELARAAGATVVFEPHNQISRARNAAAKAAHGEWLVFLDGDTLLNPATLRAAIAACRSGQIGAGGALVQLEPHGLGHGPERLVRTWNAISRMLHWAAGAFMFCRREAWEATGGFDERLYVSEEIWFSRKLKLWCRANGLRFTILEDPVVTSARKLHWYSTWQLLGQFALFFIPGAWRVRRFCSTWYKRPGVARSSPIPSN